MINGQIWKSVTIVPTLPLEILHLWRLQLPNTTNLALLEFFNTCSTEEQNYANNIKQLPLRVKFLYTRSWLRHIISNYLEIAPKQVQISYGHHGKPFITWPQPAPHFNLSHSNSLCVLAVYWNAEIGIDIELITPRLNIKNIAQRYFNANIVTELNDLSENERLHKFYYYWTIFEAKLKAQGNSIFDAELNDMNKIETINFIPAPAFQGCIATIGKLPNFNQWQMLQLN